MNLRAHCIWWNLSLTAADPDLQIMGGGGWGGGEGRRSTNGHPDPVDPAIKGEAQSPKKFFSASVWSENKGGEGRPPRTPSLDPPQTEIVTHFSVIERSRIVPLSNLLEDHTDWKNYF